MGRYRWGFDERDAYDKGYETCRWYPQTNPYDRYSYNDRKHDAFADACRDRADERRRREEEEERERQEHHHQQQLAAQRAAEEQAYWQRMEEQEAYDEVEQDYPEEVE